MRHRLWGVILAVLIPVICCGCKETKQDGEITVCGVITGISEEKDFLRINIDTVSYAGDSNANKGSYPPDSYWSYYENAEYDVIGYLDRGYSKELILPKDSPQFSDYEEVINTAGEYVCKFVIYDDVIQSVTDLGEKSKKVKWYPTSEVEMVYPYWNNAYVLGGAMYYYGGVDFLPDGIDVIISNEKTQNYFKLYDISEAIFFVINTDEDTKSMLIHTKDKTNIIVRFDVMENIIYFDVFYGDIEFDKQGYVYVTEDAPEHKEIKLERYYCSDPDNGPEIIINYSEEWEYAGR